MILNNFKPLQLNFLFYDYETLGTHVALDKISQFSCIRTDINFKILERKNFFLLPTFGLSS